MVPTDAVTTANVDVRACWTNRASVRRQRGSSNRDHTPQLCPCMKLLLRVLDSPVNIKTRSSPEAGLFADRQSTSESPKAGACRKCAEEQSTSESPKEALVKTCAC